MGGERQGPELTGRTARGFGRWPAGFVFARGGRPKARAQTGGHRHQAGEADHPQQPVLVLRTALQVGAPVARVHVSHADQDGRTNERAPLFPEAGLLMRDGYGAVQPFQREVITFDIGGELSRG